MTDRYIKWGGIAAIAYPIIQLVGQGLIQAGGREPAFSAPAQEILVFFQNRVAAFIPLADFLMAISVIVFLWFLGALWHLLRPAEKGTGWLSLVAVGSGLLVPASFNVGGWSLALFRIGEGLEPQIARLLFDEGNLAFANSWIALGSMLLGVGIVCKAMGIFPRWMGWGSIILALGLIAGRTVWTTQIAFLPYVLFWVWMIAFGIYVLRHPWAEKEREL